MKPVSILVLIILIFGCQNANENKPPAENLQDVMADSIPETIAAEVVPEKPVSELAELDVSWSDSLLKMYMAFGNNEVLKQAHKSNFSLEWMYDNTLKTDSAVYDIYRIGHEISRDEGADTRFIVDQWIYLDTTRKQLYEYDAATNKLSKWWAREGEKKFFYPVYELSPQTTAFVVAFRDPDSKSILDTIFNKLYPKDSIYNTSDIEFYKKSKVAKTWKFYDTSGYYWLMKSDKFEKEARKYFSDEFYVYGTKGYAKSRIKNITFGLSPCITNVVAFCLENDCIKSIGHSVFCSTKFLNIHYGKDYSKIEKNMDGYYSTAGSAYSDSMKTKIMGNVDNFYFYYHDDFLWGRSTNQSKCKFPDRGIRLIDNKNIAQFWMSDLMDLFGVECE